MEQGQMGAMTTGLLIWMTREQNCGVHLWRYKLHISDIVHQLILNYLSDLFILIMPMMVLYL